MKGNSEMSIPKIIHYCWFGPNSMPENEVKYIEEWKQKLPDYEFMFWTEEKFDIESVPYVRQAYEAKKYAFVADYVRLFALNQYGGIYLDTDVELLKDFTPFLEDMAFLGFENRTMVGTGVIGTVKANDVFVRMAEYYEKHDFKDEKGIMDTTTNVKILNKLLIDKGLCPQNSEQNIGGIHIYERSVFSPKKINETDFDITENSVSIHHFDASWLTERERRRGNSLVWRNFFRPVLRKMRSLLEKAIGEKRTKVFEARLRDKMR